MRGGGLEVFFTDKKPLAAEVAKKCRGEHEELRTEAKTKAPADYPTGA